MQCGARQSDAQARVDYNRTIGRMLDEEGWRAAKDGRASATGQNEADTDADLPEPSQRHLFMSHVNGSADDETWSCVSTERTLSTEAPALIQRSTSAPGAQEHSDAPAVHACDSQPELGFARSFSLDQAKSTWEPAAARGQPHPAHGRGARKEEDLRGMQQSESGCRWQRPHARNSTRIKPYERKIARTGSPALSGSSSPTRSTRYSSPANGTPGKGKD